LYGYDDGPLRAAAARARNDGSLEAVVSVYVRVVADATGAKNLGEPSCLD
jgi:hypothetical protein